MSNPSNWRTRVWLGFIGWAVGGWALCLPTPALAKLNVVATLPDLAALAREIGGDQVSVSSIAKPSEDPHFVQAKPSLVVALNRADLLIENGLDLEIGWLPVLVDQTRNAKIRPGAPGRLVASSVITPLEVPTGAVDRSLGDVHPGGNPHFLLDPERGKLVAKEIAAALARLDPKHAGEFQAGLQRLDHAIEESVADCQRMMAPYRGAKIVTYHRSFTYFAERFGLQVINTVEPKPGIPPSPSHVAGLIQQMKSEGAKAILLEQWHERRTPELIAQKTGAKVVEVSVQVGADPNVKEYPGLCKSLVAKLVDALK